MRTSTTVTTVADGRIRVVETEPLRRRRLGVLFKSILAIPHWIALTVWGLLLVPVLPLSWLALLLRGRMPERLHRFLAAYLRYQGQFTAWFDLLSARSPRPRRTLDHPFGVEVPGPQPQRRLATLLRVPLAVPAVVLSSVFGVILAAVAVASWFVAVVRGRTTAGLQELGTFCLRYQLETQAYLLLLTARYPRLEPAAAPEANPALE
jgi:uncharacterized protein DUF4389